MKQALRHNLYFLAYIFAALALDAFIFGSQF
jgi:hypothetical protein